jgi:hypothetical protein
VNFHSTGNINIGYPSLLPWIEPCPIPGKSWFIILRMYGPLEPWLDKTWRPSEIELVK